MKGLRSGELRGLWASQDAHAGAERAKKEIELPYENAALGKPARPDEVVSVERAIQLFLRDKAGQNMEIVTLRKYRRELGRFQQFCDRQGRFFLQDVRLPDLTEFRFDLGAGVSLVAHPSESGCGHFSGIP